MADFPIFTEREHAPRRAIFVGETERARAAGWTPSLAAPFDTAVAVAVRAGSVVLRSERRAAVEAAASWFLERHLGAHWFMPGPLGEYLPHRAELILPTGEEVVRPGFISRDLGIGGGASGRAWYARNRLEARFDHGHNLGNIFRADDLRRWPEMAPMRNGARYLPPGPTADGLQPDFNAAAAVRHAAAAANQAFAADPARLSFSLSENDTVRFDDSAATIAAVSPPRYFRLRPDYSDLVFRFTNEVAAIVGAAHPGRYLPAYAYYWTENTPRFPIARNVVPFLTADRSQWFEPEWAAEDRALIDRWTKSGAEIIGAYDYLEGAPFLVPRPMLYGVKDGIPFLHRAGVRAFYGEGNPNWALDGPKPWLAAQLLWNPKLDPAELLETYYREFWAEAAPAMREFFAECERAWLEQPRPGRWLKYYNDEHQTVLFPPARRAAMRASLAAAQRLATDGKVRARVDLTAAGFAVSELFVGFCAAREKLDRLTQAAESEPAAVVAAWRAYREARNDFVLGHGRLRREQPLALAPQDLAVYLRHQSDSRAAWWLTTNAAGRRLLAESPSLSWLSLDATQAEVARVLTTGVEMLNDPGWRTVERIRPVDRSTTLEWTAPGAAWSGTGEPWEGRAVELSMGGNGQKVVRLTDCRTESLGQWVPATGGALYAAQVDVRAKVTPNNSTYLIVSFLDEKQRHIEGRKTDRLPLGDGGVQTTSLHVIVRAPADARYIGFAVAAWNQNPGDFVEFSGASLRRLAN